MKRFNIALLCSFLILFFSDNFCADVRKLNPLAKIFLPGIGLVRDAAGRFPHVYRPGEFVVFGKEVFSIEEARVKFAPEQQDDLELWAGLVPLFDPSCE